jgi:hypothetical protein
MSEIDRRTYASLVELKDRTCEKVCQEFQEDNATPLICPIVSDRSGQKKIDCLVNVGVGLKDAGASAY